MRLRVQIPRVEPMLMKPMSECPYEDCDGQWFKAHQQHCEKAVRDTQYERVEAIRRKCLVCERTHRVYPQGVSNAQQTDRLKALSVMLYVLGISYRGVEDVLTALGCHLSHTNVWRNVQDAGEEAGLLVLTALKAGSPVYLDVAMVYAVFGFLGILALTRYLTGRREPN